MACSASKIRLQGYVDDELNEDERQALDKHLSQCDECSSEVHMEGRFKAALRGHLAPIPTPPSLKAEILQTLDAERRGPGNPVANWTDWFTWQRVMPMAAAASLLFFVGLSARQRLSPVMEQAVQTHTHEVPMDVENEDCSAITSWFRGKLDFNLSPPNLAQRASCQGGRIVNVRDRFGAFLRYRTKDGRRLGVMVFEGNEQEPVTAPRHRTVRGRDVLLGTTRGASAAAYKGPDGLWYVVTSDMDEDALTNVMEAAFHPAD